MKHFPRTLLATAALSIFLVAATPSSRASIQKQFFQNGDLTDGNNYSPSGVPTSTTDILLTTPVLALTLNSGSIGAASLNQLNNSAYTISNGSLTLVPQFGGGNSVSPSSADAIYLGGTSSHLTIQATAGFAMASNLDVAQSGAVLDLAGTVNVSNVSTVTKT
ncbi:MAG: hypothetical protein M3Y80_09445, partial [Verrucomicrobiota bacterium]|nr:hypothetical protein [Verrucomicrobiota bacterium]